MYLRLTRHYIERWQEWMGKAKPRYIFSRTKQAIQRGPLYGQGDGSFVTRVAKGKYAVLVLEGPGWVAVTLFAVMKNTKSDEKY